MAPDPFVAPYYSFLLDRAPKAGSEEPRAWRKDEYPDCARRRAAAPARRRAAAPPHPPLENPPHENRWSLSYPLVCVSDQPSARGGARWNRWSLSYPLGCVSDQPSRAGGVGGLGRTRARRR